MKFSHLVTAFYCEPWHLKPEVHSQWGRLLHEHIKGREITSPVFPRTRQTYGDPNRGCRAIVGPVDAESGEALVPQMEVCGPVAIIPVQGVLGRKLSMLDLWCGGCDYEHIAAFCDMAMGDDEIKTVIFDFNSPGGSARGVLECAQEITELTAVKRTIAYTADTMASAAYFLASQCSEIHASPTSTVGSIGTILACIDDSRAWEIEGYKLELFTSSQLKATGMSGKPFTDADRAYLTERMQQADLWIKDAVHRGRPNIPESLDIGQWFYGQYAVALGIVDGIVSCIDDVVSAAFAEHSGK